MTGWSEWFVLAAVAVIALNLRRLPQIGSALAQSLSSFRKGLKGEPKPMREVEELRPDSAPEP